MKKQDMFKIRRMLGDNYHLYEEYVDEDTTKWKLFEKHEGWMLDNSEAIMTSDEYSYEDLYKFAKTHGDLNLDLILGCVTTIILILTVILSFINIYFKNTMIEGVVIGIDIVCIVFMNIRWIVCNKNFKRQLLRFNERIERRKREYENKTNDLSNR